MDYEKYCGDGFSKKYDRKMKLFRRNRSKSKIESKLYKNQILGNLCLI